MCIRDRVCDVKQGVLICGSFVYDRELIVLRPAISNGQDVYKRQLQQAKHIIQDTIDEMLKEGDISE